jgi:hypothetical protein
MSRRTVKEIEQAIHELENSNKEILTGELSTIIENAPRALMQLSTEAKLQTLYWAIGKVYKTRLRGRRAYRPESDV